MKKRTDRIASVVLVGVGWYGVHYLNGLLEAHAAGRLVFAGVVEPNPRNVAHTGALAAEKIPLVKSLEEFYAAGNRCDVAVICSPIHHHCSQTCLALSRGSNVFCEKPAAATIQEAEQMMRAEESAAKWVAIGYQWSFTPAILALKRDIQKKLFGAPKRLKSLALWPRDDSYYRRNNWAGAQRDDNGRWILDSPVNNAAAHFLHNMFFVIGDALNRSARPARVTGELYRANDIENYDTAALRCFTDKNVEILFYAAHAVQTNIGPIFSFEFEKAVIEYGGEYDEITARFRDGAIKKYGSPEAQITYTKPHQKVLDALNAAGSGKKIPCGIEAAAAQTLCMNGVQESAPKIVDFPRSLITRVQLSGGEARCVKGLEDVFQDCFAQGVLPNELGVPWSKNGREINLINYHWFPGERRIR